MVGRIFPLRFQSASKVRNEKTLYGTDIQSATALPAGFPHPDNFQKDFRHTTVLKAIPFCLYQRPQHNPLIIPRVAAIADNEKCFLLSRKSGNLFPRRWSLGRKAVIEAYTVPQRNQIVGCTTAGGLSGFRQHHPPTISFRHHLRPVHRVLQLSLWGRLVQ